MIGKTQTPAMRHQPTHTSHNGVKTPAIASGNQAQDSSQGGFHKKDLIFVAVFGALILLSFAAIYSINILGAIWAVLIFILGLIVYNRKAQANDIKQTFIPQQTLASTILRGETRLADAFEEAIIILEGDLRITYANPAAQKMLAIEKPGQGLATVMRNPAVIEMVQTVTQGGKPDTVTFHVETPLDRHYRSFAAPISTTFETETKNRALLVLYDVTDIVRANDLRSDFLANASHELKTPIASLLGYVETLRGHAKDDEKAREKFLRIMQEQAERMQRLIDDLLSLRRIELSQHIAPTQTINFHQTVQSVIEIVAPIAQRRQVTLKYTGSEQPPLRGSHDDLLQAVLNLVDNAVKICPPESAVHLTLDQVEHWIPGEEFETNGPLPNAIRRRISTPESGADFFIRLRILDEGPGIDREHIPRLGERFYRISDERKKKGTGLGLAIVKHIIRAHRGGLYVQSEIGKGTEFTLILPGTYPN